MDEFEPSILEMQELCQRNADDLAFLDYCRQRTKVVEAALEKLVRHVREKTGQEPSVSLLARTLDETAALLIDRLPDVSTLSTHCEGCEWQDLCPGCDTELSMTSGGKKQCRRCGFLLTCCDTV